MKKNQIIKSSMVFEDVIKNGNVLKNKYYNIFYKENNSNKALFGFAVGKKLGNAVTRNKNKRQLKNIVDNNQYLFSNSNYYIIMLKKDILSLNYKEKKENFIKLMSLKKGEKNEK